MARPLSPTVLVRLPEGSPTVCDFRHSSNRSGWFGEKSLFHSLTGLWQ
jgi:hypothetical protein